MDGILITQPIWSFNCIIPGKNKLISNCDIWLTHYNKPELVSTYMCQTQLSGSILPKAALMPPWAATVCERVGNSLVTTAVLKPSATRPKAARRPAPPAPTTTASNWWSTTVYSLEIWNNRKYVSFNHSTDERQPTQETVATNLIWHFCLCVYSTGCVMKAPCGSDSVSAPCFL